ncbi:hypothetical protein [Paenibacillus periandrae]|uniref:hypothetical protein n=1 Tax=Paenibacillus periandrae TaxID=1761741 RepID=UPI001F089928|nr:hypothetical protein [Paenibacillus periandrae]
MSLVPLRIPMGYAVCFNKFTDIEPIPCKSDDGFLDNWEYFTEDILQIVQMKLEDGDWIIPKQGKSIIDLGWYPDGRVIGQYKLKQVYVSEDWEVIREKCTRDRYEIRDIIEEWMKNPPLSQTKE